MGRMRLIRGSAYSIVVLGCLMGSMVEAGTEPYFPPRAFALKNLPSGRGDISGSLADWFSEHLQAMDEPSLWRSSRDDERATAYRFLWLPTWGNPVAVRIEKTGNGAMLNLRQLDGQGGYAPGKIAINKQVRLTPKQWDHLATLAGRADFWDMPTRIDVLGLDGESLIVEGIDHGAYHVVYRWTPRPGAYRELCRSMLDLTGLDMGQRAWPIPPPSRASMWLIVGLLILCLAALFVSVVLRWVSRRRKPRPYVSLKEFA